MIACPICMSGLGTRAFKTHGCWIVQCKCGHRYAETVPAVDHVEKVYSDRYFTAGGDGYPGYVEEAQIIVAQGKRYGDLLERYTKPGTVLDVGAAAGFILQGLQLKGWQGIGIEPNLSMVLHAQRNGVDVRVGTLETFPTAREQFSLVTMIQVVAHFCDVRRAFQTAAALTKPGGYWLIETCNKDIQNRQTSPSTVCTAARKKPSGSSNMATK